ncbi:Hypothetical protein2 [Nesidiocoris tenuis]|nr:Hypothetical protein2 [Nesidiocoris tenuis]
MEPDDEEVMFWKRCLVFGILIDCGWKCFLLLRQALFVISPQTIPELLMPWINQEEFNLYRYVAVVTLGISVLAFFRSAIVTLAEIARGYPAWIWSLTSQYAETSVSRAVIYTIAEFLCTYWPVFLLKLIDVITNKDIGEVASFYLYGIAVMIFSASLTYSVILMTKRLGPEILLYLAVPWNLFESLNYIATIRFVLPRFCHQLPSNVERAFAETASATRYPISKICMIPDRGSSKPNAGFIGLFGVNMIMITESLFKVVGIKDSRSVLAHELGHWARGHSSIGLIARLVQTVSSAFAIAICYGNSTVFRIFGFNMNSDPPHPVIGVLISWRYVTPIVESCLLGISRVATYFCEYDADDFAVKLGLGLGLKNALLALVGSLKSYPLEDSWRTSGSAPFDNARTGQRYPEAIGFRVRRRLTVIDRQPNVAVILQNGPNFLGRSGGKLFVVTGRRPAALASVTSFSSENGPPFIFSARSIRQNVTVDPSDRPPAYCCLSRSFRLSLPSLSVRRKNSIVLRTQLSVRVHAIIEKLLNSEGRDLRRALFSLKQIFQEDKDLVHEFVQKDGLACLIKVGSDVDQHYQNYILRALGQVMLYVDGMNGVIEHPAMLQWLYGLVSSKFRLVVKTALKLLLVFVEYTESNCALLVKAVKAVDYVHTTKPWSNIMKLMKDYDAADTEILIYAITLINKTLNGLTDQDIYYDQVDALEEQGMENVIRRYMSKQGTDLDLLRQFQIYEAVLVHEDGDDEKGTPLRQLDETLRKTLKNRKTLTPTVLCSDDRRKSRRALIGGPPITVTLSSARIISPSIPTDILSMNDVNGKDVTPGLRRRRERAERHKNFVREQREAGKISSLFERESPLDSLSDDVNTANNNNINNNYNKNNGEVILDLTPTKTTKGLNSHEDDSDEREEERTTSVKDLTQKLASSLGSPTEENKTGPYGDMKGIISKAKEELARSQSRADMKLSGGLGSPGAPTPTPPPPEIKKSEAELQWDALKEATSRPLKLCDLDFEDLGADEEHDVLTPAGFSGGVPPPPPPMGAPNPPVIPGGGAPNPPPAMRPPPQTPTNPTTLPTNKTKKTVKLFWKEVRDDPIVMTKIGPGSLLWDELTPVTIDTQKLEHLFESRAKDLITKKQQEMNKNKEVIILDHKRSNAINIGMTKLPSPRSIKAAILKMDATVMNREGIEKLLTMLPTEEEISKIQEAQSANPELPLGSAEQFLLTLASISELQARLKLWAFKSDYENLEREIAEPLMDLKQGMETLRSNRTFKAVLGTLLSIGIFLNGSEVKGFQIEYLAKVPEVKDTVHKHTLLHHLCHMVMEKFPDATDLYSEIGAITRVSKVDFDELAANITKMEQECKASFDYLKVISTHDGTTSMKLKMSDFLADCAERIIILDKIHRRVLNRFHKFCLWVGIPLHRVSLTKPDQLCRVISEFALEYRTTRERVLQQLEKKASHRERNKTRGKMITEVGKMRSQDDRKDAELKELLGHDSNSKDSMITHGGSLPWRRTKKEIVTHNNSLVNGALTDADDEILETLVKSAMKSPVSRAAPRERKRTRNADRKSLRRTLRNGLTDEDRKHLAAYIKGY